MQTKSSSIQVPLEFAEAQYLRGLTQSSKLQLNSQSDYLDHDKGQSQIFFPLIALTLSLLFLGFNGIVFVNRQADSLNSNQANVNIDSSAQVLGETTTAPNAVRSETTREEYLLLAQIYLNSLTSERLELDSVLGNLREKPVETDTIKDVIADLEVKIDKIDQTQKSVKAILTKIESSPELKITSEEKMLILAGNTRK